MFGINKKVAVLLMGILIPNAALAIDAQMCPCYGVWAKKSPAGENLVSKKARTACSFEDDTDISDLKMILKDDDIELQLMANVEVPKDFDYQMFIINIPNDDNLWGCGIFTYKVDDEGYLVQHGDIMAVKSDKNFTSLCRRVLKQKGCQ